MAALAQVEDDLHGPAPACCCGVSNGVFIKF
jgi:hypothetical protein